MGNTKGRLKMTRKTKKIQDAFIALYWSAFDDGRVAFVAHNNDIVKILSDTDLANRRKRTIEKAIKQILPQDAAELVIGYIEKKRGKHECIG